MAFFQKMAPNPRSYNFLHGSYINLFYIPFSKLSYFNTCLCKYTHMAHILVFSFKNEKLCFGTVCPTEKTVEDQQSLRIWESSPLIWESNYFGDCFLKSKEA